MDENGPFIEKLPGPKCLKWEAALSFPTWHGAVRAAEEKCLQRISGHLTKRARNGVEICRGGRIPSDPVNRQASGKKHTKNIEDWLVVQPPL